MIALYYLKNDLNTLKFFVKNMKDIELCYIISDIEYIENLPQNYYLSKTIPVLKLKQKYRIFSDELFGPVYDNKFVKLSNKNFHTSAILHLFMFYYDELVYDEYGNFFNLMDFIRLYPQNKYFESSGFLKIKDIPNKKYIGIITPSLTRKTMLTIEYILQKIVNHNEDIIPLYYSGESIIKQGIKHHGENFKIIWNWLLKEINVPIHIDIPAFYSNLWILKREYFIDYLNFLKKVINKLENAPIDIQIALKSNSMYVGKISAEKLLYRTGYSYYTYYPFILERIICLYVKLNNLSYNKI
jgi:hypothetical protein